MKREFIFYRWITVIDIWKGELPQLWGFGRMVTPLWVWEEP